MLIILLDQLTFMYTYMYMYIYIHMHVHVHVHMYTYMYMYMYIYMYTCTLCWLRGPPATPGLLLSPFGLVVLSSLACCLLLLCTCTYTCVYCICTRTCVYCTSCTCTCAYCTSCTCTCTLYLIGMHELHGRMHPN